MLEEVRRRLALLTVQGVSTGDQCAARLAELRQLKRQVLEQLLAERDGIQQVAEKPLGPAPTARELWQRRDEGARALLRDVTERVTGLVEGRREVAVAAWSELNGEIDRRLRELQRVERRLRTNPASAELPATAAVTDDDALYAAAAGGGSLRNCAACGQSLDVTDRFCRRCGKSLTP